MLYLKHKLSTSAAAPTLSSIRSLLHSRRLWLNPELGVLFGEERLINKHISALIAKGDLCVDVGGHIGSMSGMLRNHAGEGNLTIVEASPTKAAWLRSAFSKASVHVVAVSDTPGEIEFFEDSARLGFSSVIKDRVTSGATGQTVPCVVLDDILPCDPGPSFIKIDIEGFEYPALVGATETIKISKPTILFEAGSHHEAANTPSTSENLFQRFDEAPGYRIFSPFQLEHKRAPHTFASFVECRLYPFCPLTFLRFPKVGPCRGKPQRAQPNDRRAINHGSHRQ